LLATLFDVDQGDILEDVPDYDRKIAALPIERYLLKVLDPQSLYVCLVLLESIEEPPADHLPMRVPNL